MKPIRILINSRVNSAIYSFLLLVLLVPSPMLYSQSSSPASAQPNRSIIRYDAIQHAESATQGMVVSQRKIASDVGAEILAQGGNAVDAAVAVGFALAVVLPRAGNLGGGGFMMIHMADENLTTAIDYRESAPQAAHTDIYLKDDGTVDDEAHRRGHRAAGVPGTVAGLNNALERFGTMTLAEVIAPAIKLAADGFILDHDTASAFNSRTEMLTRYAQTAEIFFKEDGSQYRTGELFQQADLANTLRQIANGGPDAFYKGPIADLIVAEMIRGDGLITKADLAAYTPKDRVPVQGQYRGHEIFSMPPPSSGGIHLIQMLNVLENFDVKAMGSNSAAYLHLLTETMKRAYADRSQHLGDPDFYSVPQQWLTSKSYAAEIAGNLNLAQATPSEAIAPALAPLYESEDTTHFSVVDRHGNVVSNTYTINFSFGSGIVVEGAGFLLNNEMADFSAKAGVPYAFGLIGGEANAVEPQKRPLSAMTPTLIFRDGKPVLITGSPGGSRIITTVLQQILNVIDHDMNIAEATHRSRIHHQWFPDVLQFEGALNQDTLQILDGLGHELERVTTMGSLQSIQIRDGVFYGSSDPRRPGGGVAGID